MTIKIFWQDPYLTQLITSVKTVKGNQITLSETIFYAFSGGQESDEGTISGYPVLKAQKVGKDIYYTLSDDHKLRVGDVAEIVINWERRYQLMRLHFAAELVLELMLKKIPSITKVGAHIAENKARIDFKWDGKLSPFLGEIQMVAQSVIDSNQPIISAFSDELTQKRYWQIKNFAAVPCGGTHLRNTGEVGLIKLKRANPGKGIERIEIFLSK